MSASLVLSAALLSLSPAEAPKPAKAPDDRRFELHLGARGGGRFAPGSSFGGSVHLGLGVRIWRGLWFEASVGEGMYQGQSQGEPEAEPVAFRHFGPHDQGASEPVAETSPSPTASATGRNVPNAVMAGQILLGLRYELRPDSTRLRPSVFAGLTHAHEATLAEFLDAPGRTLAGTGDFITHRTGLAAGLGLRVPFPERWGSFAPRVSARFDADLAYYFDDAPGRLQAGLGVGVQFLF